MSAAVAPVTPAAGRPAGPVVRLEDLHVAYGRSRRDARPAVRGISLEVAPGEVVALVGESGSGKSSTAHAVLGLLPASGHVTGGRIEVDGLDVTRAPDRVRRRQRGSVLGLVPQDPGLGLDPTLRVGVQVAEVVRRRGVPRAAVGAEVLVALADAGVDDPELRARQYPHELSGGLRQRVLIALALAGHPRLLVADEPTSALDVTVQRRILDHLEHLVAERGIGLLVITHDLAVAADRADRVLVLSQGRVVEQGPPAQLLVRPEQEYTRRLLAAAPGLVVPGLVVPGSVAPETPGTRTRLVVRHATPDDATAGSTAAEPVLRLHDVTVDFPQPGRPALRALDGVGLAVPRGRTLAVVGESGSGKTTALRVALGLQPVTGGRVELDGRDVTDASWAAWRPLRRRVQLVHQNPFAALDPRFTVEESVTEPLVSFRLGGRAERRQRARELLDRVGLPAAHLSRLPAELSGGQRQRVAIARALAVGPELLLLDEPVSALDVSVQAQVLALLADLQADLGVSYLFVSHDLAVVAEVAHRVAVLRRGRLVEEGPAGQVLHAPADPYTAELLDAVPGGRHAAAVAALAGAGAGVGVGA
ncbi:dipeptide ABC transporter ATP-binding protein [Cellulomonas marina]|uniref:Peptide/nickel transport system ATP-binding protein n=1 Tax=Cellulomonas marina TaxID=988821 RepID=A0A1I0ZGB2_9CELL|nr:ABC transporter ATP-binding protein [Cellulomonas marina]GIG28529.1 ABC transporter ATP-binding protein [Cellulomonas marina]SFB24412.1 peptide/nickel transport system ATP-binding protein [Cellulomonas marina]